MNKTIKKIICWLLGHKYKSQGDPVEGNFQVICQRCGHELTIEGIMGKEWCERVDKEWGGE